MHQDIKIPNKKNETCKILNKLNKILSRMDSMNGKIFQMIIKW